MIDIIRQQLTADMAQETRLNKAREVLQLAALKIIYDKDYFRRLSFTGGTALRVLFDLKRFSEDLDFSLVEKKGYDFNMMIDGLLKEYALYGLKAEAKPKTDKNVHSVFLKFPALLKEVGLSALKDQKLAIKLEIDSNPPQGGRITTTLVNKVYMFNIVHFDLPSLFATKLHACFFRKYAKGRDFYDLVWYLSKKTVPNFVLLNNAIKQTQGYEPFISEKNFKSFLLDGISKIDFSVLKKDVERFLEDRAELKLLDAELIKNSIETFYPIPHE
jgi:hypothetical protein